MRLELGEKFEVGVFLSRLNRFLAEVKLGNKRVLAHLPNSGRLVTVLIPKSTAFLRKQSRVGRKSGYDLFAVGHGDVPIIVDTRFSTIAAKAAFEKEQFEILKGYSVVKTNVKIDHSLMDLLLKRGGKSFFSKSNVLPTF